MLKIFTKYQIFPISTFNKQPIFFFAGSHGQKGENHGHEQHDHNDHDHHEIDLGKMKLREEKSGYYIDPNEAARRMFRVIAQFDKVDNPENVTLKTQWHEMGLNELDTVELLIGIEDEFQIEFPDDVVEKFKDVNDAVEYVSRSFWSE